MARTFTVMPSGLRLKKPWKLAAAISMILGAFVTPAYVFVRLVAWIVSLVPPVPASSGEWTGLAKIASGFAAAAVGIGPTIILTVVAVAVTIAAAEALLGRDY